jgi:hypothetical protein
VEIGRVRIVELIDELAKRLLLLRRALQLQQHMRQWRVVREGAAIVDSIRFGTPLMREPRQVCVADRRRDLRRSGGWGCGQCPALLCMRDGGEEQHGYEDRNRPAKIPKPLGHGWRVPPEIAL